MSIAEFCLIVKRDTNTRYSYHISYTKYKLCEKITHKEILTTRLRKQIEKIEKLNIKTKFINQIQNRY